MLLNIIITLLLIQPFSNIYSSDISFFDIKDKAEHEPPQRINLQNIGVEVAADRFVAIDINSGKVLLQKDSNIQQPIASITKLMTALVILDKQPDWQVEVEMQQSDETVGAYPHLYRGERVLFIDLWKAALVTSDNNAIKAMIRALGLGQEEFVNLMNQRAEQMQMYNSRFADPTGLDENNISTALDVSRLVHLAMQRNEIRESVLQSKYSFKILNNKKTRRINNTDILVNSFLNSVKYGYELIGGKTGFLNEAGYCLAVEIAHEHHPIVIVVLNSPSIDKRFQDVKVVADWVFSNHEWK